jgi:hypothetical protein
MTSPKAEVEFMKKCLLDSGTHTRERYYYHIAWLIKFVILDCDITDVLDRWDQHIVEWIRRLPTPSLPGKKSLVSSSSSDSKSDVEDDDDDEKTEADETLVEIESAVTTGKATLTYPAGKEEAEAISELPMHKALTQMTRLLLKRKATGAVERARILLTLQRVSFHPHLLYFLIA